MKTNDYLLTPVDSRLTLNEDLLRANSTDQSHKTQRLLVCFWKIKSFAKRKFKATLKVQLTFQSLYFLCLLGIL